MLLPPSPASSIYTIRALECGRLTHPVLNYISAVQIGMFLSVGFSQGVPRLGRPGIESELIVHFLKADSSL